MSNLIFLYILHFENSKRLGKILIVFIELSSIYLAKNLYRVRLPALFLLFWTAAKNSNYFHKLRSLDILNRFYYPQTWSNYHLSKNTLGSDTNQEPFSNISAYNLNCPNWPKIYYYLTLIDSYGDGWEGTVLSFSSNRVPLIAFSLTYGYLVEKAPIKIT